MNIDPSTTKYLIQARLEAEGIVEKPDVVGAVFGQTEGLLGEELDLRDLQKSGRIGRIEVDVQSKKGRSEGTILIPSSLDQVETSILAAALETIDRVGPCKATIKVDKVEDTRVTKRNKIIERARSLLSSMVEESKTSGSDLLDEVRQSVQVSEIVSFGAERLPAGPNVADSDAIIIVEGRQDVLNLLRSGIKNAIAVEGTNVPKTIQELSKERALTAFVDGDRGGDLILKELLQVAEVDFIARAPRGKEVEELTQKQIMKCLRNKIPADQYVEMYGLSGQVYKAESEFPEPKPASGPQPRAEPRPEPPHREEHALHRRHEDGEDHEAASGRRGLDAERLGAVKRGGAYRTNEDGDRRGRLCPRRLRDDGGHRDSGRSVEAGRRPGRSDRARADRREPASAFPARRPTRHGQVDDCPGSLPPLAFRDGRDPGRPQSGEPGTASD